MANTEKSYTCS